MIDAFFFDGRSARLHPARLLPSSTGLVVSASSFERSYARDAIALSEPFAAAPAMLRFADGASCEIPAGEGREQLLAALGYRQSAVERWQAYWPAALLALALLVGLLAFAWLRGVPWAAEHIAARLPASVDTRVGQAGLASLEKQKLIGPSRLGPARIAEIEALLPAVQPAQGRLPLRLLVRDSPQLGANALALPDGTIIVTDGLVRLAMGEKQALDDDAKAELIGVLGHEAGHVEHRHTVRVMARSSLTAALSATLFGDFSAVAAGLPAVLSQMAYSREMELDADAYAIEVLHRRHLSVDHFADILGKLEKQQDAATAKLPRWLRNTLGYVSTHPDTDERIGLLDDVSETEKGGTGDYE